MSKQTDDGPKVVIHEIDHAEEQRKRLAAEDEQRQASVRAGYVTGLENELAYLERQPEPNKRRIAEVKDSLAQYGEKPARRRETAVPQVEATPPPAVVSDAQPGHEINEAPASASATPPPAATTPDPVVTPPVVEPTPEPVKAPPAKKAVAKKAPAKKAAVKKTAAKK